MKSFRSAVKTWLASVSMLVLFSLLVPVCASAQNAKPFPPVSDVPDIVNPNETEQQRETHFLTFIGSFKPQDPAYSQAYYNTIDPINTVTGLPSKPTFPDWLLNAGFISDKSQWHPFGPQKFACNLPGCDFPAGTYGDNIINTDAHVIVLNAADLGFVRNQFIRCSPSCTAKNPKIYTYLENYPVAPFAVGGSNFGSQSPTLVSSAYPLQSEAAAAISAAINRPLGVAPFDPAISLDPTKAAVCAPATDGCLDRIADVAFEWAPPATNPNSSTRFGQLYAYQFFPGANNAITETVNFASELVGNAKVLNQKTGQLVTVLAGDKFAPNLDFIGFKQHPDVCLVCHGGAPVSVPSGQPYPHQGNINGFRFLPLDNNNLLFTSDSGPEPTSRANQEAAIKVYNQEVLLTVPTFTEGDGTGATRTAHLRQVIIGWYSSGDNYSDDQSMSNPTQKTAWIPKGWRDATHGGTAPAGAEKVYTNVVAPSCRSCHFNREISLDFGTYANFHQESDLKQLALMPQCKQNSPTATDLPDKGGRYMPLAHLTFERFWQTQGGPVQLGNLTLDHEVDRLARDFGYSAGVSGYCATNP
jgi:hypothetical protein